MLESDMRYMPGPPLPVSLNEDLANTILPITSQVVCINVLCYSTIYKFGNASAKPSSQEENDVKPKPFHHKRSSSLPPKDLPSFAEDYRKLAIDRLKVLRVEMQLETVFNMQVMATREYLEDQDAEEPDDYVISLVTQITRRDEVIAPFIAPLKRNYVLGGICVVASHASIKPLQLECES